MDVTSLVLGKKYTDEKTKAVDDKLTEHKINYATLDNKVSTIIKNKVTSRNLIDSSQYIGLLVSSNFYDSAHKTAKFVLDKSVVLSPTQAYRGEVFFSDGTKADLTIGDISMQYYAGTTLVKDASTVTNTVIGTNAPTVDTVWFNFGANSRVNYASKTITGFVVYANVGTVDIMATFEPYAFSYNMPDVETLKVDSNLAKLDIVGLKSGISIVPGAITPEKTSFINPLNLMDIATIYKDKTLITGVLYNSVGSTVIEIPVTPSTKYYITRFSDAGGVSGLYDINKAFLGNFGTITGFNWNIEILMPSNCYSVKFVLLDIYKPTMYWGFALNFGDWLNGYTGKLKNISQSKTNIIDAFLPKEIYCAVGRTIELYNNQVCLQASKYNMQWVCTVGRAMKRKFVIEGVTGLIGDYTLTLNIYDDSLNIIWSGSTTVKIVDATITNSYPYCALGDSLTSLKMWLAEVQRLSAKKLTQIGKIPFSLTNPIDSLVYTGQCDGRGGFSADSYLKATTSDDSLAGGINEGVHAFWNPTLSRFDWNYYKATLGISPSFVQIFLGTNGASLDTTINANNIKQIIDYIRQDEPNIPIYMVNTLYRGNQDGIGSQGNNEGFSASGSDFKYSEDKKVFNLMTKLSTLLSAYTNLYFIPVALTFDSENNFGAIVTPINPRATLTELLPLESVHPVNYMQMADNMFSTFCGTLT